MGHAAKVRWRLPEADSREFVFTGLTRDGTFLVETGQVVRPVKNFGFIESPLFILSNVEAITAPERTAGEGFGSTAMPCLRVCDFDFTSPSDAV